MRVLSFFVAAAVAQFDLTNSLQGGVVYDSSAFSGGAYGDLQASVASPTYVDAGLQASAFSGGAYGDLQAGVASPAYGADLQAGAVVQASPAFFDSSQQVGAVYASQAGAVFAPQAGAVFAPQAGAVYGPQAASAVYVPQGGVVYGPAVGQARVAAQPPPTPAPPKGPTNFDLDQARLGLEAEQHALRGNLAIFATIPSLTPITSLEKAQHAQVHLTALRRQKRHLMLTGKGTQADRDQLDDIRLQQQAYMFQAKRRGSELFSNPIFGGPSFAHAGILPPFFEGQAHQASQDLAKNSRDDAAQALAKDPSRENWLKLQDARDDIAQQQAWKDANTMDVLGGLAIGGNTRLASFAPLKRIDASQISIGIARRDQRHLEQEYAKNPNEDNWWALRINRARLKALADDINANVGEAAIKMFTAPDSVIQNAALFMNGQFQGEEENWVRYSRLSLQNLRRKRAEAARQQQSQAAPNSVQARLMAMGNYGPTSASHRFDQAY